MKARMIPVVLAVLAAWPLTVEAQEGERPRARTQVGPRAYGFIFNRGRIGVLVKTDADARADQVGARIEAVTPGGPAEKAGLKADDIITRFNGVSLAKDDDDDSNPGAKLVRLAQALDPGDTVRLDYRRGTENRTATLVAEEVENRWDGAMIAPRVKVEPDFNFNFDEGFPRAWAFAMGQPWGDLELVKLNPDLGEYFGTQEGLLVVRAPEDEGLDLKGGDVILAIDGRKPSSAAHAMRILRSYDGGESVKIDVMRKQRRLTVTWTVPDRERMTQPKRVRRGPVGEET
jgi:S1-C subfamily serine protease